jgi:hypothetical protein
VTGIQPTLWPCYDMGKAHEFDWWHGWVYAIKNDHTWLQGSFVLICRYCGITSSLSEGETLHSLSARMDSA